MTQYRANTLSVPVVIQTERLKRLQRELEHAWSQTSRADLMAWGASCGTGFVSAAARRVKNVAHLAGSAAHFLNSERKVSYLAWKQDRLLLHLKNCSMTAGGAIRKSCTDVSVFSGRFAQAFKANPKEAGVHLLTVVVTSLVVSGGPDGNGGAPDLDLMFGIDAHRSFLSHSILMGAALETCILSLLAMIKVTHAKLPDEHDGLWDALHDQAIKITHAASQGVSIGMAYHLLVDGLIQPAPYHDLPISMPIAAHQSLFVVNGLGEAIDIGKKQNSVKEKL